MTPPKPSKHPRLRAALRIVGSVLLVLVIALVSVLAYVLHHLETPAVKTRLQAVVKKATGIELEYESARAALGSGLHLENVTIATAATLRDVAPELLHIGTLDVTWSIHQLLALHVDTVTVKDVKLVVVLDDDGRTSFEFLPPPPKILVQKAQESPSTALKPLLSTALPLSRASVSPVAVSLIRTHDNKVYDDVELRGLTIDVHREGTRKTVDLGQRATPLALSVRETGTARTLALEPQLWLEAVIDHDQIQLLVDLHAGKQTLVPGLDRVLALDATLRTEPSKGQLTASVLRAQVADDTLTAAGEAVIPDDPKKPIIVKTASGHLDSSKLLALVPKPLVPKQVLREMPRMKSGDFEVHAEQLALDPLPRVLEGGHVSAKGELADVHVALPGIDLSLPHVKLDVRSGADRRIDGTLDAHLEKLRYDAGKTHAAIDDARLELAARELDLDPQHRSGAVDLSLHAASIAASTASAKVALATTSLVVKGGLTPKPPYAANVQLDIARATVVQGGKKVVDDALVAHLAIKDVQPDGSRAVAKGDLHLGSLALDLDVTKLGDLVDWVIAARTPTLALVSPFASGLDVPWSSIGLELSSKGSLDSKGRLPLIAHETHVALAHFSVRGPAGTMAASSLVVDLASHGTTKQHEGKLGVVFGGLRRDGTQLGDGRIDLSAKVDTAAPSVSLAVTSEGTGSPGVQARADFGFDRARRRLAFDLELQLKRLAVFGPLLGKVAKQIDLQKLEVAVSGKGEMSGLVDDITLDGKVRFAKDPLKAIGDAHLGAHVKQIDWHLGDRALSSPDIGWDGALHAGRDKRSVEGSVSIEDVHAAFGANRLGVKSIADKLAIELDGEKNLALTVNDDVKLNGLTQDFVTAYVIRDVRLVVQATATRDGVIRVPVLHFENAAAGTSLDLKGGLDLSEDRRSLALRGSVKQDLDKLWTDHRVFIGHGLIESDVVVNSGDLQRFQIQNALRMNGVSVELPLQKIKVSRIDGEIPATADIVMDETGTHLVHLSHDNSYSELRFADQHPMFSRHSFLTIAALETPWITISPFAGNLAIDDNILSLSQLELGIRGGHVTGRAEVQLAGQDTHAELNLRASNVRSSHGEPFDGNTALDINVRQRSVDGRAEILRIGRRHLLDVLDVVDPTRTDRSMNKVRRVLSIAYPDHLRLEFKRGFASAKVEFGGLGRLIKLDEIRGIPMGPIIDRAIGPMLKDEDK